MKKIASDIKLVFHSSTIPMMHGPINIRLCIQYLKRRLRVLETRVMRRIFGPKREEVTGEWRKLHNEELTCICCTLMCICCTMCVLLFFYFRCRSAG